MTGDYKTPATSAFNVASSPYWGVEGVYQQRLDPWRNSENRQFMHNYYQLTTEFAKRGGVTYPVRAGCGVWSGGVRAFDALELRARPADGR
jgi:hypothetical protein